MKDMANVTMCYYYLPTADQATSQFPDLSQKCKHSLTLAQRWASTWGQVWPGIAKIWRIVHLWLSDCEGQTRISDLSSSAHKT